MNRRGRPPHPEPLTPREQEVVDLVAKGMTNREVATQLDVTEPTVRYHLNQVYSKLGIERREDLRQWRQRHWIRKPLSGLLGMGLMKQAVGAVVGGLLLGTATLAIVVVVSLSASTDDNLPQQPEQNSSDCGLASALIPAGATVSCVTTQEALQAAMPFPLEDVPLDGTPTLERAAQVGLSEGDAAYRAYRLNGVLFEILEGPVALDNLDRRDSPLVLTVPGQTIPPFGFFESLPAGPILWWCPEWDGTPPNGPGAWTCTNGRTIAMTGLPETELSLVVYRMLSGGTYETSPGVTVTAEPSPVPFPPLRGERVSPFVDGLPVFPGAIEVDGFLRETRGNAGPSTGAVQVLETTAAPEEVLAWYAQALVAAGWIEYHGSASVAGRTMEFTRHGESGWVQISTAYVPRPEDEGQQPPPGFGGKGVPFAGAKADGTRFWVVSWRQ